MKEITKKNTRYRRILKDDERIFSLVTVHQKLMSEFNLVVSPSEIATEVPARVCSQIHDKISQSSAAQVQYLVLLSHEAHLMRTRAGFSD